MAEKNKSKLTPFQQEQVDTAKKIKEFKLAAEANIVSALYKAPEEFNDVNLTLEDFSDNVWKVYYTIAHDIFVSEQKNVVDELTVGLYLEKHPNLREKYDEYGGWKTIESAKAYVEVSNLKGYMLELKKWKAVLELCKRGFPVKDRLSDYADMTQEEIYQSLEAYLNHVFINVDTEVKSFNVFDGMDEFVDELDNQEQIGLPFYNAPLLTNETGGFNYNGNIYGFGAASGVGKSTMAFNFLVPSAMEFGEQIVFIINEEDEKKFKKELLVWVANNIFGYGIQKHVLRNGKFTDEVREQLNDCAKWIDERKDDRTFTVIPLQHYSVDIAIKIINKYSALGVKLFVLDTLKESFNAKSDEIWKTMTRDLVKLYDCVKPANKNVGLFVTYQLGKASLKMRYLTNNEIGQAKSIIDVMAVNLMARRPFEDEYFDGDRHLRCWSPRSKNSEVDFDLKREDHPMIISITKNRFGQTNVHQIVTSADLSTNTYKDLGYCIVPQDF